MAVMLPFLLSMLLGRTIDLKTYSIGTNIYDDFNSEEKPIKQLNSVYHVLQGKQLPYEYFNMPMDVVLRIKATELSSASGAMGVDGLLRGTSWMHNSAVVAATVVYTSAERSLSKNATLLSDWTTRMSNNQTHYAQSVTMGGWFMVLYRFKCDIPSDANIVRKMLVNILGTNGTIDKDVSKKWDQVRDTILATKEVRGEITIESYVYSSVQLPKQIGSIDTLYNISLEFPAIVEELPTPMYMKLELLSTLDSSFPKIYQNQYEPYINDLKKFDLMYTDVVLSRNTLMTWIKNAPTLTDDEEEKVTELLESLTLCLKEFLSIINNLSLFKDPEVDPIKRGFQIYGDGLAEGIPDYYSTYLRLKEEIDADCDSEFLHGIRGLLKIYDDEGHKLGDIGSGGIEDCKKECLKHDRCRSIGYSDEIIEIDEVTGNYVKRRHQCWIYYRSTSTADIQTPNGLSGDIRVYDRECF